MSNIVKQVTTRKEHQCFGCLGSIPAGRTVEYFVDFEEDFSYGYNCEICKIYLELYGDSFNDMDFYEGDLGQDCEGWEDSARVFEERTGTSYNSAIVPLR